VRELVSRQDPTRMTRAQRVRRAIEAQSASR
jgi:hypothetical protein